MIKKLKPAQGRLLISSPGLADIFKRTVIYITEHSENGTIGFILNKLPGIKIGEVVEDLRGFDAFINVGGPVQQDMVNFIHRDAELAEQSLEISNGVYWGGNFEKLSLLAFAGALNPDDFKFFLGYSGWRKGQLESEIALGSWYISDTNSDDLFNKDPENLWRTILKNMGGQYASISVYPDDPIVN